MATTKSRSRSKKSKAPAEDTAALVEAPRAVSPKPPVATKSENHMTSILEFSIDVMEQEAPPPLPKGDYPATIRGAELKTSATTGNPYVAVQFYIDPDSYPVDFTEGNPDGTVLTFNVSTQDTPQARYRLRNFIEAIGGKGGSKIDVTDWVGLSGVVEIVHEEWEGVVRAKIARVKTA